MGKVDFNKNHKETKISGGSYEDMLKQREEKLPQMQEAIQTLFDNWHGQPIAVVMVEEDENGDPKGAHQLIVGAGKPESQLRLAKGLDQASNEVVKVLAQAAAELDVDDMMKVVKQVHQYLSGSEK